MSFDFDAINLTYSFTPGDPIANQGDLLTFQYQVMSLGTEAYFGPVSVRVLLSDDPWFSRGDSVLYEGSHAGTFIFGNTVGRLIPFDIAPGNYNLILMVDYDQQIAESDEDNNYMFVQGVIINRSDLTENTAAGLFDLHGKLALMAQLAAAAYHLTEGEVEASGINHRNAAAEDIFASLTDDLTMLDDSDMPSLARLGFQGPQFPVSGLRDGIYTNENAAALIARSADAVFLAFRGTNDNTGVMGALPFAPETPDGDHWVGKDDHFALFQPMMTALADYMTTFGLTKLYVTGHSLGAAMAQAFMEDHPGLRIWSDTFASPGYGIGLGSDVRISNLWIDGDPITKAAVWTGANSGDQNKIYHNLMNQVLGRSFFKEDDSGNIALMTTKDKKGILHSANFYSEFTKIMQANGIGEAALSGGAPNTFDYDRVYINATLTTTVNASLIFTGASIEVGVGNDSITGSTSSEIIIGHTGNDTLKGEAGFDYIVGGSEADWLYGGANSDQLLGGDGHDRLFGGSDRDTLTGGAGTDVFVFTHADLYSVANGVPITWSLNDTITDFVSGTDKINLSNIDTSFVAGDQGFTFVRRAQFSGTASEVRFGNSVLGNTIVQGDVDGNGSIDFSITLIGLINLMAADFIL